MIINLVELHRDLETTVGITSYTVDADGIYLSLLAGDEHIVQVLVFFLKEHVCPFDVQ